MSQDGALRTPHGSTLPSLTWLLLTLLLLLHLLRNRTMSTTLPRRFLFLIAAGIVSVGVFYHVSGTHDVLLQVVDAVTTNPHSIRSTDGLVEFAARIRGIAAAKFLNIVWLGIGMYLLLQTFCIPGTIALNVALGSLLGVGLGVPLCTLLGTIGACLCYTMSGLLGGQVVERIDAKLTKGKGLPRLKTQVAKHRSDLFVYMLFLRLTPVLPNWLINLASPIVGVPWKLFAAATCLGIFPQTYLSVRFGSLAHLLSASSVTEQSPSGTRESIVSMKDILLLAVLAVTLVVVAKLRKKFIATTGTSEAAE